MKTKELKSTDLRIGNYLKRNNKIVKVTGLSRNEVKYTDNDKGETIYDIMFFQPIELTEEILLNIGFEKGDTAPRYQRYYWEVYCENGKSLRLSYDFYYDEQRRLNITFRNREGIENEVKKYEVKYIHELQNAYYCLTSQELEVKL